MDDSEAYTSNKGENQALILFLMTIMSAEEPVSSGSRAIEITRYN